MTTVSEFAANIATGNDNLNRLHSAVNDAPGTFTTASGVQVPNLRKRLEDIGYMEPVPFTSGLIATDASFTVVHDGKTYSANPASIPFTTTGVFNPAQWVRPVFLDEATAAATAAAASQTAAAGSASTATTAATAAAASQTAAAGAEASAIAAANSAMTSYDAFDDRYLGAKASNPTLDNDGNPIIVGALYWNTTNNEMRTWTGATWLTAYVSTNGLLPDPGSNGLVARTAAGVVAARSIAAGTGVTVTNDDGVAGNPTVAISAFTSSKTANGYVTLPGGVIIQWGQAACAGDTNSTPITWPITFPNGCLQATASQGGEFSTGNDAGAGIFGMTATGANLRNGASAAVTIRYLAIGH